jgi:plastocyanin
VSSRVLSIALVLGFVLAACSSSRPSANEVSTSFVPQTVDFLDNVGQGVSIALDKDGNPQMAYIGQIQLPKAGVIPPAHPASAPALPAVLTASQSDGIFRHGFVAQTDISSQTPVKVPVDSSSTTGIAIGPTGALDVVWSEFDGVFFASAPNEQAPFGDPVSVAPVFGSSPAVAVDSEGTAWVAFVATDDSGNSSVQVASFGSKDEKFGEPETVASYAKCDGCPARSVAIVATDAGPVVAYADPVAGSVSVATRSGTTWTAHQVQRAANAGAVSMASGSGGSLLVAFRTPGDARLATATDLGSSWSVTTIARFASSRTPGTGDTTSVGQGKDSTYVAYTNPADKSVGLSSRKGSDPFRRIATPGTEGGQYPALAVTPDGHVNLAWYDSVAQDLELGLYPESLGQLALPPSPTPFVQPGAGAGPGCAKTTVAIIAPIGASGAGFQTTAVTAKSGTFQLCFDNEDVGVTHNVEIFKTKADADAGQPPLASDTPFAGPKLDTFNVSGLAPGDYFFHCIVHPGPMTGTLTVS